MNIKYASELSSDYRGQLESLIYFNPKQQQYIDSITHSIKLFGQPEIVSEQDKIKIQLDGLPQAQTLFALTPENALIGLMIYVRVDKENLVLIHIAVAEEYSSSGRQSRQFLVLKFVQKLKEIAQGLKDVSAITLMYSFSKPTTIKIRK